MTSVAVVNSGTIGIVGSLPYGAQNDALSWILYGQMMADRKYNRTNDPDNWYKENLYALGKVGMAIFTRLPGQPIQAPQGGAVNELVLNLLTPYLTGIGQLTLPTTLNALKNANNKAALDLLNQTASQGMNANIQVLDGNLDDDQNIALNLGYLNFKAKENINNLLYWKWTQGFSVNYGQIVLNLSPSNADKYRTLVSTETDQVVSKIIPISFRA